MEEPDGLGRVGEESRIVKWMVGCRRRRERAVERPNSPAPMMRQVVGGEGMALICGGGSDIVLVLVNEKIKKSGNITKEKIQKMFQNEQQVDRSSPRSRCTCSRCDARALRCPKCPEYCE